MRGGDLNFWPFALAADFLRRFRRRRFQKRRTAASPRSGDADDRFHYTIFQWC